MYGGSQPNQGLHLSDDGISDNRPLRRLPPKRLKALRAMDPHARVLTIVDSIAWAWEVIANAEEAKDQNGALRVVSQMIDSLRREDQHVGAKHAELAEAHAELLKELRALKRGSGVLAGTLPEGDEGDSPVH